MSSPVSSLRKSKKSPLLQKGVPYRYAQSFDGFKDVDFMLESPLPTSTHSTPSHEPLPPDCLDSTTQRSIVDALRKQTSPSSRGVKQFNTFSPGSRGLKKSSSHSEGPNLRGGGTSNRGDEELLVSMTQRLGMVERELLLSKREVIEKSNYINELERKIVSLEAAQNRNSTEEMDYLQRQCQALQTQVDEMEEFLNDYGMVWVGKAGEQSCNFTTSCSTPPNELSGGVWSQSSSLPSIQEFSVNYDKILENIKQLNILAGEGSSEVTKTPKGAQLKVLEPIPLVLYKNGLALFAGPFRPFTDPSTQQVVRDLIDGYFPSELKSRYPEGVPLQCTDNRDVVFRQRSVSSFFPGSGHMLGGDKGPSRLLPNGVAEYSSHSLELLEMTGLKDVSTETGCEDKTMVSMKGGARTSHRQEKLKETSELPGKRLSMEQFLSKLPQSVVKSGRVMDIRSSIKDTLQGDSIPPLQLVETAALEEIQCRLSVREEDRPPTPSQLTTLRIKTKDGEQTYVLKMKSRETIGDVRKYIDKILRNTANGGSSDYVLKTTFPSLTLTDNSATLIHCGLVPSAILYMAST